MINCMIVDDEVIAQQILEQYILQTEGLTLVAKCRNAMEALAKLEQHRVNLIFLDIGMPLVSGVTFLKNLQNPPRVIFTTAYAEYALQGYELNVVDYLLKPISYERFVTAVGKVKMLGERLPAAEPVVIGNLVVKEKEGLLKIAFADILYIEGSRDYMKVITPGKSYLVHLTMKKLEELLPAELFIRVHKSYIVAVEKIRIVRPAELVLTGQEVVPVSPLYKDEVLRRWEKGGSLRP